MVSPEQRKQIQDGLAEIVHEEGFDTKNEKVASGAARLIADLIRSLDPGADVTVETPDTHRKEQA